MRCTLRVGVGVTGVCGVLLLGLGIGAIFLFDSLLRDQIKKNEVIKKGSYLYDQWSDIPVPIFMQFWVWDLLNPEEVLKGEKPAVIQKGPYTYSERVVKTNITFHDNGTVSYLQPRTFTFLRNMSVGPENDTFTSLNIPLVTIAELIENERDIVKDLVSVIERLAQETLFMKLTVGGLVWGYNDSLLMDVNKLVPGLLPSTEFGLFMGRKTNGTDGVYSVFTGNGDVTKVNIIDTWDGQKSLNYWSDDPYCNMINGTDGNFFPPFITKDMRATLFSTDICRSVEGEFIRESSVRGIPTYRYEAPERLFQSGDINPANKCYCQNQACLPSGLLNISICKQGAPVIMSSPHFYLGDPSLVDSIIGMHPDPEQHKVYFEVEPLSGILLAAGKRLQANIYVKKIDHIQQTGNVREMFYPILWLNESTFIDPVNADKFKSQVTNNIKLMYGVEYGMIAVGCVLLIMFIILFARLRRRQSSTVLGTSDERTSLLNGDTVQ
ncbi:PREDICTED: lysosome membrane protein 2-like isoform X1 [Branchiostoma belcheri]|uniref:Lysosome membrane protein 2-like isoform X1 n=1 Tax=Branchiostoma belcheri TaxID=7741 RepID=A0A6P4YSW2_BRABE|nr:PREDICTED: lysosome membrane protein 2-like isoform X1 [Branchiostoma belcheri]